MYISIFELLLIMLAGAFFVLLGGYFVRELLYIEEIEETPHYDLPIAPVQVEEKKKKKDEDDTPSFY